MRVTLHGFRGTSQEVSRKANYKIENRLAHKRQSKEKKGKIATEQNMVEAIM